MNRSRKEITAEVDALKDAKTFIPKRTIFGESNIEKLDVQIEALEDDWDEDKAEEVHGEDGECPDEKLLEAALEAIRWRDSDDHKPSAGWEMYRPKKGGRP